MKSVLITGCTPGGIGHALAKEYHARGLQVFATARKKEVLSDLAALGIETLQLDVSQTDSVKAARDAVASITGGTLNIRVNNAGLGCSVPATDLDLDDVKTVYEANVFGPMRMVQEFASLLIASSEGRIVNIGSMAGIMPVPFGSAYNSSKAALHAYSNTLRLEMAPFNVQVTTVVTGGVNTSIYAKERPIKDSSIYSPIADVVAGGRIPRSQVEAMITAETYAKHLVSKTLNRSVSAWMWEGSGAWICWTIDKVFGRTAFDWMFSWSMGLYKLKSIVVADNKKKRD
ncbi:NAD(P)-binding protein [Roridomyces roridus]|uniref:NAD(P)-binding protein n=1 Tax=Roridomyces roridus TaxID=1738132 RepID=A0AAD7F7M3_9AGAR|nr:NAD(P)-binding protein [Roridomyces roridus]